MGLTKRKDGWYVEFPVIDDGKVLTLARGTPGARVKRWKTGTNNKTMADDQATMIKNDLMKGMIVSERVKGPVTFKALAEAYLAFPDVKRQSSFSTKQTTIGKRFTPYFGGAVLNAITPSMIEQYREKRRQEKRENRGPLKVATLNRDLALLKHMFSFAIREEWVTKNPVGQVKLWKENNVRVKEFWGQVGMVLST